MFEYAYALLAQMLKLVALLHGKNTAVVLLMLIVEALFTDLHVK